MKGGFDLPARLPFWETHKLEGLKMAKKPPPRRSVRAQWLGNSLRKIRDDLGLTLADVSERSGWDEGKVSRVENGVGRTDWSVVDALLTVYGVSHDDPRRAALVALARALKEKSWWKAYAGKLAHPFADFLDLEGVATGMLSYEPLVIPGLLQTPEYALAVVKASRTWEHTDEVERFVDLRIQRKAILTREQPHPVEFWAILSEAALRPHIGGTDVMRAQLQHLLDITTKQPNITLQVLPFSNGAATGMAAPFVLLSFPSELTGAVPEAVVIENLMGGLYLEDPDEVGRYNVAYEHLRASALPSDQSINLIRKIMKEL